MPSLPQCTSAAPDEEELCDTLQEHIERLEQRDLASMRQGAVLRRKLEELRELRRDRHGALQAAQRRAQERRQAEESEMARRGEAAARALEAEFHGRWEAARGREEQLEERLRAASGRPTCRSGGAAARSSCAARTAGRTSARQRPPRHRFPSPTRS
ncbi:unnamed protein product [Prorocentrum cordatum]|uniref:Uncharacterized protein n=1 Tax=Prorocentrum cordatum TaxID=2364126 RepID=A0ABN9T4S5_9DINO|nr:unnamed protein product [Polarella glacialis]